MLLAVTPVAGLASMVGESNHPEFVATDLVNDAVGEFPQRKTTPAIPPNRAKTRVAAQKRQ